MAITQTAVSYYGLGYVEHAAKDFAEMVEHGCTTVILAVTEFDFDFWRPNLPRIVEQAQKLGLRVIIDPWGIGKFFGGESVSRFLQNNIHHRQVSALTGESLPAACMNTVAFRDYFANFCLTLAQETAADGFFWDECKYAKPGHINNVNPSGGEDWTCRCPECMTRFREHYGYEMPRLLNDDVINFREQEALVVLSETSRQLKELKPDLEITCCVHATHSDYYQRPHVGYDNWDLVCSCPYFDVFSTTIIAWSQSLAFVEEIANRTVKVAQKYGKKSERWLLGYYQQPEDWNRIGQFVDIYEKAGVDQLSAWTYRGGYGTVVAAPDAIRLWDEIGRNYSRILRRK